MQAIQVQSRVRKIPWRRKQQPSTLFLRGKSHGQRVWQATVDRVTKESDKIQPLNNKHICTLQLSCAGSLHLALSFQALSQEDMELFKELQNVVGYLIYINIFTKIPGSFVSNSALITQIIINFFSMEFSLSPSQGPRLIFSV